MGNATKRQKQERQHGDGEKQKARAQGKVSFPRAVCARPDGDAAAPAPTPASTPRSSSTKPSYCHPGPAPLFWLPSEGMPEGAWA